MSRITKPCPVCGGSAPRGGALLPCCDCMGLIEWAKSEKEAQAKRERSGEVKLYRWVANHYSIPGFYGRRHSSSDAGDPPGTEGPQRRGIRGALFALAAAHVVHRYSHWDYDSTNKEHGLHWIHPPLVDALDTRRESRQEWSVTVACDPRIRDLINRIDSTLRRALDEVTEKAWQDGKSLLMGLASGDMSMTEFNERSTKG